MPCAWCGRGANGLGWADPKTPRKFRIYKKFCSRPHFDAWQAWEHKNMENDPREMRAQKASRGAVLMQLREWQAKYPNRPINELDEQAAGKLAKVAVGSYSAALIALGDA